jgi:hydrogenase maturation protease
MSPDLSDILAIQGKKILFTGIGNVLRNDDGVAVYISERIRKSDRISALTVETSIENYIGKINSLAPDILILIDTTDFKASPGTWRLFRPSEIKDMTFNTHNISLHRITDFFPMETFILGIQPENVELGERISGRVRKSADKILQTINKQEV